MQLRNAGDIPVIAELANTHEGELDRAQRIIHAVSDAADAIKFQAYSADDLTTPSHPNYDSFDEKEFSTEQWDQLVTTVHDAGLDVYADIFGQDSLSMMAELGVDGFKIHTADITNEGLLQVVAAEAKPVFLSAGGSTPTELRNAITVLERHDCPPAGLIYGFQAYPTALGDTHLRKINGLCEEFEYPIGFAPHIDGGSQWATELPSWGVCAGADLLEIHVTVDREEEPSDYESSLTPADFTAAVKAVQEVLPALGEKSISMNSAEQTYRKTHKKYVVVTKPLTAGNRITETELALKRVPEPSTADFTAFNDVIGRVVTTDLSPFTAVRSEHVSEKVAAVLACRAESDRLYAKPMQKVGNRPIIEHLTERLERVTGIHEIVLAIADTPSKSVFIDYATRHGYPYVIGSEPDVLSRLIKGANAVNADTIVRTTTENPFVYWENIDKLLNTHHENENDLTTVGSLPSGTHTEIIAREALERSHRQGEERHRSELCTLYINENPETFTIEKVEPPAQLQRPDLRLTIDQPSDLIMARAIVDGFDSTRGPIPLPDIIDFLDQNPDIRSLNDAVENGTRLY